MAEPNRLQLPQGIDSWSLTSLQQRLVKTGGRLIKHARYSWLLLAESHLTRRLFASMLRGSRCWRYRQDSRPRWWLRNWLRGDGGMEGGRWEWAANRPEQASRADEAMELAAFVDQLQPRPRKRPDCLCYGRR